MFICYFVGGLSRQMECCSTSSVMGERGSCAWVDVTKLSVGGEQRILLENHRFASFFDQPDGWYACGVVLCCSRLELSFVVRICFLVVALSS